VLCAGKFEIGFLLGPDRIYIICCRITNLKNSKLLHLCNNNCATRKQREIKLNTFTLLNNIQSHYKFLSHVVGVEKPHKFWMRRHPRNVRQTSRQISTTARSATFRRY
jgi:hypothetical protein